MFLQNLRNVLEIEVSSLNAENGKLKQENTSLKTEVDRISEKLENVEKKIRKNEDESSKIKNQEKKIQDLNSSLSYVESLVMDIGGYRVMYLMNDKGSYTVEAELCILHLLDYKVAFHHVAPVIKAVSHLCNVQILKLPSEATVRRINTRRLAFAHMQIDDVLKNKDNLTLYSAETSKNGNKYLGMYVSNEENIYAFGLRDMSSKSSKATLDTFKEIIQDICQSGSNTIK